MNCLISQRLRRHFEEMRHARDICMTLRGTGANMSKNTIWSSEFDFLFNDRGIAIGNI